MQAQRSGGKVSNQEKARLGVSTITSAWLISYDRFEGQRVLVTELRWGESVLHATKGKTKLFHFHPRGNWILARNSSVRPLKNRLEMMDTAIWIGFSGLYLMVRCDGRAGPRTLWNAIRRTKSSETKGWYYLHKVFSMVSVMLGQVQRDARKG